MRFLVVSGAAIKTDGNNYFGYGPYIKELNIWAKYVDELIIISPYSEEKINDIDLKISHAKITFYGINEFSLLGFKEILKTLILLPTIVLRLFKEMRSADHIHLRCPSNMGLIGAMVQILFPLKTKSTKYAANWDWGSKQPWSSRMQQRVLRSPLLTKNMTVLVYGNWPDRTKNIRPFFTASYTGKEKTESAPRNIKENEVLELLFVGGLVKGKAPLISAEVVKKLNEMNLPARLTYFGDGPERRKLETFIVNHGLEENIILKGNRNAGEVKEAFQKAHFLVFISKSEGWPKVVAESMFWGCYPITTRVSMVPEMIDDDNRGSLVDPDPEEIIGVIQHMKRNPTLYYQKCENAMKWSRQFTLDEFDREIEKLLVGR